jgi:hypothetical protein
MEQETRIENSQQSPKNQNINVTQYNTAQQYAENSSARKLQLKLVSPPQFLYVCTL